jgi:hypothetical protein
VAQVEPRERVVVQEQLVLQVHQVHLVQVELLDQVVHQVYLVDSYII